MNLGPNDLSVIRSFILWMEKEENANKTAKKTEETAESQLLKITDWIKNRDLGFIRPT